MGLESIIEKTTNQAYKVGQLKSLLRMVYETVDEKHIAPSLRESIKTEIQ